MNERLRVIRYKNVGPKTGERAEAALREGLARRRPWITTVNGPHEGSYLNPVVKIPIVDTQDYLLRVRTSQGAPVSADCVRHALNPQEPRFYLEDFKELSQTIVHDLDDAFWASFPAWETALEKKFTDGGLPTDVSDVGYQPFWRQVGPKLISSLEDQHAGFINFAEVGAGAGRETNSILRALQQELDKRSFSRIKFAAVDRSPEAIAEACKELEAFKRQTVLIQSDAVSLPIESNPFLREKLDAIVVGNMFDNFPADQYVYADGAFFSVQARTYINGEAWNYLTEVHQLPDRPDQLLLSLIQIREGGKFKGRDLTTPDVLLWKGFFDALRQEQQLVPVDSSTAVDNAGTRLRDFKIPSEGFSLFNTSKIGIDVLKQFFEVLRPNGAVIIFDAFRNDLDGFMGGVSDPTKFDGSTYQRVNREQLELATQRSGLLVKSRDFSYYNPRSHSQVMVLGSEELVSGIL